MIRNALITLAALTTLSTPAFAEDAKIEAKVKAAIVETIQMTSEGKLDAWMSKWCDPKRCGTEAQKADMRRFQLKQANLYAKSCMAEGDTVVIKQKKGEVTDKDGALWYVKCEGRRFGVPIRMRYDAEKDKVSFLQLSF